MIMLSCDKEPRQTTRAERDPRAERTSAHGAARLCVSSAARQGARVNGWAGNCFEEREVASTLLKQVLPVCTGVGPDLVRPARLRAAPNTDICVHVHFRSHCYGTCKVATLHSNSKHLAQHVRQNCNLS